MTTFQIIHPETSQQLSLGEEGEMLIKGPQVMKGYLKNREATDSTVKDGWLHTGMTQFSGNNITLLKKRESLA